MIVTDDVRYPASAETTMKSSSDPHTRRSNGAPYQSRTAPVTAGRIGKLLTHHVTAKALSTFVRLMTSTGRTMKRTQYHPSSASSTQRAVAGAIQPRRASSVAATAAAASASRSLRVRSIVGSRGYSAAGRTKPSPLDRGAFSPSLFFLLKPHRSLKNFPAGSLRSASTVR